MSLRTRIFAVLGLFLVLAGVLLAQSAGVAYAQSTAPTISTVAITSNPGTDNTYATGDTITVSLTFSEAVTVDTTDGTPYVRLTSAGGPATPPTPATGAAQLCSRSATPSRGPGLQRGVGGCQQPEAQRRDHPGRRRLRQRHPHPLGHVLPQSQGRRRRRLLGGVGAGRHRGRGGSQQRWAGAPATRRGSGSVRPPRPAPTATSPQQRVARRPRTPPRRAIWAGGSMQPSPTMTPTARAGLRRRPSGCCRGQRCPTQATLITFSRATSTIHT